MPKGFLFKNFFKITFRHTYLLRLQMDLFSNSFEHFRQNYFKYFWNNFITYSTRISFQDHRDFLSGSWIKCPEDARPIHPTIYLRVPPRISSEIFHEISLAIHQNVPLAKKISDDFHDHLYNTSFRCRRSSFFFMYSSKNFFWNSNKRIFIYFSEICCWKV